MKQYFSFQAKIARLEFALTTIGLGILSSCISACCDTTYYDPFSGTFQDAPLDPLAAIVAVVILTFLLFWEVLTFCKRLNDINRTKWWVLLTLVPLANFVLWLYLCFKPGAGSQPYAREPLKNNPDIQTHTFEDKFKSDNTASSDSQNDFCKVVADIERLGEMHKKGLLTDEEFTTLKKKLLDK